MSDPTSDPLEELTKASEGKPLRNSKEGGLDLEASSAVAEPASEQRSDSLYDGRVDDLHNLLASPASSPGSDEEDPLAQLRNDPNYAALIRDLEYIASQARLLFEPADEAPSDEVWTKIKSQLGGKSSET